MRYKRYQFFEYKDMGVWLGEQIDDETFYTTLIIKDLKLKLFGGQVDVEDLEKMTLTEEKTYGIPMSYFK